MRLFKRKNTLAVGMDRIKIETAMKLMKKAQSKETLKGADRFNDHTLKTLTKRLSKEMKFYYSGLLFGMILMKTDQLEKEEELMQIEARDALKEMLERKVEEQRKRVNWLTYPQEKPEIGDVILFKSSLVQGTDRTFLVYHGVSTIIPDGQQFIIVDSEKHKG